MGPGVLHRLLQGVQALEWAPRRHVAADDLASPVPGMREEREGAPPPRRVTTSGYVSVGRISGDSDADMTALLPCVLPEICVGVDESTGDRCNVLVRHQGPPSVGHGCVALLYDVSLVFSLGLHDTKLWCRWTSKPLRSNA